MVRGQIERERLKVRQIQFNMIANYAARVSNGQNRNLQIKTNEIRNWIEESMFRNSKISIKNGHCGSSIAKKKVFVLIAAFWLFQPPPPPLQPDITISFMV